MSATTPTNRLLAGVTVVDFTRVLAGPYCTRMLADLGADVIKLERPGEGDEVRTIAPQLDPAYTNQSAYFARINSGKRGVAIDFTKAGARELVYDLVRQADVVVENFSPGVMKKYGFDHESLAAIRPGLVYCSISGFGQSGPLSSLQAYAHLINAFSGLMELERGGRAAPRASNLQAADVLAGAHAFGAINAALLRRARTGQGAWLDVSMLECMVAADDVNYPALLNGGTALRQPRSLMVVQPIGERHIAMQVGGAPTMWPKLARLMGRPELEHDPRFATPLARRENWDALLAEIGAWLQTLGSIEAAMKLLSGARVPAAPMMMPEEIVEHPHLQSRGAFPTVPHPVAGKARVTATPFQIDGAPTVPAGPPPWRIGEHTAEVLAALPGYTPERIAALQAAGVVVMA
jgi:CoA:oxalate CoA-transferase